MDEARRVAVVRELTKGPFSVPAERVVIGRPIAIPLQGVEAERIYSNLILNTESQGFRGTAGGVTGGPFGGPGMQGTTGAGVGLGATTPPGR
jgi:hypothetical protein